MDVLNNKKPKLAIIIDKEGWAFSNAANEIKKYLSFYYNIDIIPMDIFQDNAIKLILYISDYDLTLFMWRGILSWLYSDYSKNYISKLGFEFEDFLNKYIRNKNIVTSVYDHLFLENEIERTDFVLQNVKAYTVCSQKLKRIYDKFEKQPSYVISDGIDLDLFKMEDRNKYKNLDNRTIKIGWTGNSKFEDNKGNDLKGLKSIIEPAINELQNEGYNITLEVADRNIKLIPHNEMPKYYNNIDIYVCASRTEGHPDPVLEAMACGIPIISTDVGIVPELFGPKQTEFIINRTKDELKEKIIKLINNKELMFQLSEENLQNIKNWSWENKANMFKKFFDENLK